MADETFSGDKCNPSSWPIEFFSIFQQVHTFKTCFRIQILLFLRPTLGGWFLRITMVPKDNHSIPSSITHGHLEDMQWGWTLEVEDENSRLVQGFLGNKW